MTNSEAVPTGTVDRTLRILEALASQPEGVPLAALADELNLPRSACHRLLADLVRCGYVRQLREMGDYTLTTRLPALGLSFLGAAGIVDIAQPIIDRLAEVSGELVRLALVDGDRLTFVAKAQGARAGLRYDPDMGIDVRLSCSAGGHAWLMTLSEERATELVARQGFGPPREYGPKAPTTFKALMKVLEEDRKRGFSLMMEMYAPGMSAMAAPVLQARRRGRRRDHHRGTAATPDGCAHAGTRPAACASRRRACDSGHQFAVAPPPRDARCLNQRSWSALPA